MTLSAQDTLLGGAPAPAESASSDSADEALVIAAQGGDRAALEELLNRHYLRIFSLCRRMLDSEEDACDAAQEAAVSIVRNLPKFSHQAAFSTWAYRIAVNACFDEISKRKRRPLLSLGWKRGEKAEAEETDPVLSAAALSDTAESAVTRVDVQTALAALPDEFRVAVVLRDQGELSYAEIAELLDVPIGTVRSRIARGRAELAEKLGEETKQESRELNEESESLNVKAENVPKSKRKSSDSKKTSRKKAESQTGNQSHE